LPHVVLRAQLLVKVGVRPRALWFQTHCLGHCLSSYQKHQKLRGDDLPPPTCSIVLGLPVPESMFCDILWVLCAHSIFFRFFICFSIRFVFVLVLVIVILLHFDSVLVIVTKISLAIAILFYALVSDDHSEDDAGLSSGAGMNLKVRGTCQARSAGKKFCRAPPLFWF